MSRTVLVVDDEPGVREQLAALFRRYGFQCRTAASAAEARALLASVPFDLATVDVLMPGESGIELTRWIKSHTATAVIMVTSLDDDVDAVVGLEVGADDYVAKPFDPRLLLARAHAVLRRGAPPPSAPSPQAILAVGEGLFKRGPGDEVPLSAREVACLRLLVESAGRPVSRDRLSQLLYDRPWSPLDRAVDNFVARLRQKVEPDPTIPRYVVTVRHEGYMAAPGAIRIVP